MAGQRAVPIGAAVRGRPDQERFRLMTTAPASCVLCRREPRSNRGRMDIRASMAMPSTICGRPSSLMASCGRRTVRS